MAIEPVKDYGRIDQSNAKRIYTAYRKGEIDLTPAQRNYTESFLSDKDLDEIDYEVGYIDSETGEKNEAVKDDAKKAESHDGQGLNAAATSAGTLFSAASVVDCATVSAKSIKPGATGCFVALAAGAITAAAAAACAITANAFDNAFDDRVSVEGNSSETNETLDTNAAVLEESMESMNEDMSLYQAQSKEYTMSVNEQTSDISSLEMELKDAMAAGDKEGAQRLRGEIAQLQKQDFGDQKEGLEEIKGQLDEYQFANDMAIGVSQSSQSVSEFLKEGTPLGVAAVVDAAGIALAGLMSAVALYKSVVAATTAAATPFVGWVAAAAGYAGAALFGVAGGFLVKAGWTMGDKAKHEFECGEAGRDMQDHIDDLNDMTEQQAGYMDETNTSFTQTDSESAKSQGEAQKAASKVQENKAERNNKPVVAEESKPAATGSGTAQQNA